MTTEKQQLKVFLHEQLSKGVPEVELRTVLKQEGGWTDADLDEVIFAIRNEIAVPLQEQTAIDAGVVQATAPLSLSHSVATGSTIGQEGESRYTNGPLSTEPLAQRTHNPHKLLMVGVVALGVCILGGVGYAYVQYSGVFSRAPYNEENLLRGLIASTASIDSATYRLEGSLVMGTREADARPFVLKENPEREVHKQAYLRDYERLNDVEYILSRLGFGVGGSAKRYSPSLNDLQSVYIERTDRSLDVKEKFNDPLTNVQYEYQTIDNGANYELVVTFETAEALSAIRDSYGFDPETTKVQGKTVTFTMDSPSFFFLSKEPPEPFLVALQEQARMLPPEMNSSLSIEVVSDTQKELGAKWSCVIDSEVDLGDMTYTIAGDVRKVDEDYYLRVRNLPGIFLVYAGIQKDMWMKISPDEIKGNEGYEYSVLGSMAQELPELEDEYVASRKDTADFFESVLTFAEEEKLVQLRRKPVLEKVGDRNLYRYEVRLNYEAFAPFVRKVIQEAEKNKTFSQHELFTDNSLLEYLESAEGKEVFEYLDANTSLVIHVDPQGYLAQVEQKMRLIPPDTAVQLADKQGNVLLTFSLVDINKKIQVEAPKDAVPLEQILKDAKESFDLSVQTMIPTMKSLSAQAIGSLGHFFSK